MILCTLKYSYKYIKAVLYTLNFLPQCLVMSLECLELAIKAGYR